MFAKKPTVERLRQYKKIKIRGFKFVIQKLNPYTDFSAGKMPQIFTSFISRRKVDPDRIPTEAENRKHVEDMRNLIAAGVVKPKFNETFRIKDIMSDSNLALKLYTEILVHSLNAFKGIKGVFFSVRTKRLMYTEYAKAMEKLQQI